MKANTEAPLRTSKRTCKRCGKSFYAPVYRRVPGCDDCYPRLLPDTAK